MCIFLFIWGLVCIDVREGPKLKLVLCSSDIVSVPWGLRARLWWRTISPQDPLVTTGTTGAQNCSSKSYVCPEDITEFLMSARQTLYRPRCLWEIIFQYDDNIIECGGIVYFCYYFASLFDFAYFWSWISMFYIVKDDLNLWILLLPPLEYEGNGHELPCQVYSSLEIKPRVFLN